jgi:hypothetical protein
MRAPSRAFARLEAGVGSEAHGMAEYALYVFGADGEFEGQVDLDCVSDGEATRIAFGAESPFGHELWRDGRFLGWFGAGARSLSDDG